MKRIVFLLLLVYVSSILNVSELYAQKVQAGWIHVTTEKEKKEKKKKEKKEKEQKEIRDYTHSVGIAVGSSYGLAYKYFFKDNLALKVDATSNVWRGMEYSPFFNFDFNPNVVYQMLIKTFKTCRLDFFVGGGTTLGYACSEHFWDDAWHNEIRNNRCPYYFHDNADSFVWGLNAIVGLEINLAIPMTIEFDLRPVYGLYAGDFYGSCRNYDCNFRAHSWGGSFFDWSLNATISYKF